MRGASGNSSSMASGTPLIVYSYFLFLCVPPNFANCTNPYSNSLSMHLIYASISGISLPVYTSTVLSFHLFCHSLMVSFLASSSFFFVLILIYSSPCHSKHVNGNYHSQYTRYYSIPTCYSFSAPSTSSSYTFLLSSLYIKQPLHTSLITTPNLTSSFSSPHIR